MITELEEKPKFPGCELFVFNDDTGGMDAPEDYIKYLRKKYGKEIYIPEYLLELSEKFQEAFGNLFDEEPQQELATVSDKTV